MSSCGSWAVGAFSCPAVEACGRTASRPEPKTAVNGPVGASCVQVMNVARGSSLAGLTVVYEAVVVNRHRPGLDEPQPDADGARVGGQWWGCVGDLRVAWGAWMDRAVPPPRPQPAGVARVDEEQDGRVGLEPCRHRVAVAGKGAGRAAAEIEVRQHAGAA